jgi:hypothetical protein
MVPWPPPTTEETGAMGREIESRYGIGGCLKNEHENGTTAKTFLC